MLFSEKCRYLYESGKTLAEVAKELKSTPKTITKYIKKAGGKTRNQGTRIYEEIKIDGELLDFFIGTLLGDGTLRNISVRSRGANCYYSYSDKNKNVCLYVISFLEKYGFKCSLNSWVVNNHTYYSMQTNSRPEFSKLRDLFYDGDNGRAKIPNIIINGNILKWWHIDDGSLSNSGAIYISRLKKDYNEYVFNQLKKILGDDLKWYDSSIYIPRRYSDKFFKYIGKCPIKEYKYKWAK